MKRIKLSLIFTILCFCAFGQNTLQVDSAGIKLRQFYLNENVEHLWLAGIHVNWETGEPDKPDATKNIKSHCSSFVASVCKQKHIYILRPPEHKTTLLANAQYDWLFTQDATDKGWKQIKDSVYKSAQILANKGYVVIAVCKNPNPKKSGHIAFVMPFVKKDEDLSKEGPTLIQAGMTNSNFISLKEGFKHHIVDWNLVSQTIAFFYCERK